MRLSPHTALQEPTFPQTACCTVQAIRFPFPACLQKGSHGAFPALLRLVSPTERQLPGALPHVHGFPVLRVRWRLRRFQYAGIAREGIGGRLTLTSLQQPPTCAMMDSTRECRWRFPPQPKPLFAASRTEARYARWRASSFGWGREAHPPRGLSRAGSLPRITRPRLQDMPWQGRPFP